MTIARELENFEMAVKPNTGKTFGEGLNNFGSVHLIFKRNSSN
jgi:hypothetical protein